MKQHPFNKMKIVTEPWQNDMNSYYADKDFVISSSLFESFHMSIAEGMLTGCIPLIHNWFGAENIYPHKYIWNTVPDCLDIVSNYMAFSDENKRQARETNRIFIQKMYSVEQELSEIKEVLASL